jgi:hypothetical protein
MDFLCTGCSYRRVDRAIRGASNSHPDVSRPGDQMIRTKLIDNYMNLQRIWQSHRHSPGSVASTWQSGLFEVPAAVSLTG